MKLKDFRQLLYNTSYDDNAEVLFSDCRCQYGTGNGLYGIYIDTNDDMQRIIIINNRGVIYNNELCNINGQYQSDMEKQ